MKRKSVVVVFTLLVLTVAAFSIFLSPFVKRNLEHRLSQATGVAVSIEDVQINIFSRRLRISGLRFANPEGFDKEDAILRTDALLEYHYLESRISRLTLKNLTMHLVSHGLDSNLDVLYESTRNQLSKFTQPPTADNFWTKPYQVDEINIESFRGSLEIDYLADTRVFEVEGISLQPGLTNLAKLLVTAMDEQGPELRSAARGALLRAHTLDQLENLGDGIQAWFSSD